MQLSLALFAQRRAARKGLHARLGLGALLEPG